MVNQLPFGIHSILSFRLFIDYDHFPLVHDYPSHVWMNHNEDMKMLYFSYSSYSKSKILSLIGPSPYK